MSFGDLSRINTNVQALQANAQLQRTNQELGLRQLRLATGSRLNRAEDDSAGYSISKKLEARVRGQAQALANIGDAKSMLTVAEGSLNSIMDVLQTMKEKAVQAANDTMGTEERAAIESQLEALTEEIHVMLADADFNGTNLFTDEDGDPADVSLSFQVGADSDDTFGVTINQILVDSAADTLFEGAGASLDEAAAGSVSWDIGTGANARLAIDGVDNAITVISEQLANIGDSQKRLTFKQDNLQTSMNNYEAARSRINDADFAKEQMELVKLQILQQTGTAALAQSNAAPQAILSLIGG